MSYIIKDEDTAADIIKYGDKDKSIDADIIKDEEQITLIFNYIKLYFIKKEKLKYFSNKVYKLLNEYFYLLNNCYKKTLKKILNY